ncbi:MAG: HPr family phosphocarrier protein [Planctomycetes bacterium]|nr:HPr family phosphocarrier protein [Planctomycetota bacterium]
MERIVRISNKSGIHVRPAAQIAETSNKFQANVVFIKDGIEVNAKSIMELLTLAAGEGTKITIKAEGADEAKALDALEALVNSKFSED